ncbi:MAG: NAD(P)H-dependent oxidoreductase subunit E [Thiotrichales bacterium]|nr:NAD(P)H-dependent oxidoreductase subunit E [Thiotrichales bacterium]MBT3613456.1 NAD(P)H-dependent oxidoreductase subunit E [Thiotrichales bacterium]MBT3753075.1 NAD(P)H-dependent oxidoreductase subunit E [Thiotrichales bacterium]MBT3837358.1 NAD(P)H-dependent oxidoreductase subunit E [Thiotrichales bacterium]MBT4151618.1 NAD(P)H-dependent oxidoreductase subunit E [Thiotrichales bacterium]
MSMISDSARSDIENWVDKYPAEEKQSAVMAALRIVQDENSGSLTTELMNEVATLLEMPEIAVYEVATFYSMYELKLVGRHKICVCTNISCMLNNSKAVVDKLEDKLGVKLGETTADGEFTLKEVECLGACVNAPVVQVGENYYEHLNPAINPDKIDQLLAELRGES